MKYAKVPVVAAPFNMALGGGAEFCLHADAINAYAETYMGLVEIGVGLLPGGGGTKEMSLRAIQLAQQFNTDPQPFIIKNFQQIAMAKVSMGAAELFPMGYMRSGDAISMDIDRLIGDAKEKVLALAVNYRPKQPAVDVISGQQACTHTLRTPMASSTKETPAHPHPASSHAPQSHIISSPSSASHILTTVSEMP